MPDSQQSVLAGAGADAQPSVAPRTAGEAELGWEDLAKMRPAVTRESDAAAAVDGDDDDQTDGDEDGDLGDADTGEAEDDDGDEASQPRNDYETKFKGLQRTVQQQAEELKRLQAERQQVAAQPQLTQPELQGALQIESAMQRLQGKYEAGQIDQQTAAVLWEALNDKRTALAARVETRLVREQMQTMLADPTLNDLARQRMVADLAKHHGMERDREFRAYVSKGATREQVLARAELFAEQRRDARNGKKVERLERAVGEQRKVAPARGGGSSSMPRLEGGDLIAAVYTRNKAARVRAG